MENIKEYTSFLTSFASSFVSFFHFSLSIMKENTKVVETIEETDLSDSLDI